MTTTAQVGPDTGVYWCESRWGPGQTYDVINSLTVYWKEGNGINEIDFVFTGDSPTPMKHGDANSGSGSSKQATMTLAAGEVITGASMWGDGDGMRLGAISLRTASQTFEAGWSAKGAKETILDIGSGLLLGAYGGQGESIDNLQLLFLTSAVTKTEVTNVQYTDLNSNPAQKNLKPVALLDSTIGNSKTNKNPITATMNVAMATTISSTYEQTLNNQFGAKVSAEFDAEPLGVGAKVTAEASWGIDFGHTSGKTGGNTTTLTQSVSGAINPGDGLHCTLTAMTRKGDFPYTSDVVLTLQDNSKITYSQNGNLNTEQYSAVFGGCVPANDPKAWEGTTDSLPTPQGAASGSGKWTAGSG